MRSRAPRAPTGSNARLRYGDQFAARATPENIFTAAEINSTLGTVEIHRGKLVLTVELGKIEQGLLDDTLFIVEDGPETDPRWEEAPWRSTPPD